MSSRHILLLLSLVLATFVLEFMIIRPPPTTLPQSQSCDVNSCPMPTNEQLFQHEQQKRYLDKQGY